MLELAADEQEYFIEKMKEKVFEGKTPSSDPAITLLIGAPGSGKSSLAKKINNSVSISTDAVIAEYAQTLGIDIRENFYDNEIGKFAARVSGELLNEAVRNKYNIVLDNSSPDTAYLIHKNPPKGYRVSTKVLLVDEYQAALNAIERKMDTDDAYTRSRQQRGSFSSDNVLDVNASFSLDASQEVVDFIQTSVEKNFPIEVYEYGRDKPSFRTGDDFDRFVERLELPSIEQHLERIERLSKRAQTEDDILGLNFLKNKMKSGEM